MKFVSKTILACSFAAASMFGATAAQAADFNPFIVNPINSDKANFTADKITGNYVETAVFGTNNTFTVSLVWTAGQFVTNEGTTPLASSITGLGSNYGIYATYTASGTVSVVNGVTTFTFLPSPTDTLTFMLDVNGDNVVTGNKTTGAITQTNLTDDILLATGAPLSGVGTLDPSLSTCGTRGINCGSFGSSTTFNLTSAGESFFVSPNPFYGLSFQSGQLNNFNPTGVQLINGSLDVVFADVPEPASLGLLGLGLLGLGFVRGRKQS